MWGSNRNQVSHVLLGESARHPHTQIFKQDILKSCFATIKLTQIYIKCLPRPTHGPKDLG